MARHTLGICYTSKNDPDLVRVLEIAKEESKTHSEIGRKLVNRGLAHIDNPNPLFPKARSPVKPTIREDKPEVSAVNEIVSNTLEPVSGEQSPQLPSGDKLKPDNKADRVADSSLALDKKKSPEKDKSNAGWILLGIAGAGLFTWLVRKFC